MVWLREEGEKRASGTCVALLLSSHSHRHLWVVILGRLVLFSKYDFKTILFHMCDLSFFELSSFHLSFYDLCFFHPSSFHPSSLISLPFISLPLISPLFSFPTVSHASLSYKDWLRNKSLNKYSINTQQVLTNFLSSALVLHRNSSKTGLPKATHHQQLHQSSTTPSSTHRYPENFRFQLITHHGFSPSVIPLRRLHSCRQPFTCLRHQ